VSARRHGDVLEVRHASGFRRYRHAAGTGRTVWLSRDGHGVAIGERENLRSSAAAAAGGGPVTSPMPGTVLVVKVAAGDTVSAGTPLLIVEAMKMEHTITAPIDGVVSELHVRTGQQVALDEPLAVVTPHEESK
jgi:acetyl-CoA/propionyl-CoA carboxylase biotin carboxyl carrier protein